MRAATRQEPTAADVITAALNTVGKPPTSKMLRIAEQMQQAKRQRSA